MQLQGGHASSWQQTMASATAMTMAGVATASATETKTAATATEGTMAGCDDQNGNNRVKGSEYNDGNKGIIGR